ncbi:MAG: hypothetical protein H7177_05885 [Rhizobacter sp.]|nr:hypothetical protein [Bacteriovorax sp.]
MDRRKFFSWTIGVSALAFLPVSTGRVVRTHRFQAIGVNNEAELQQLMSQCVVNELYYPGMQVFNKDQGEVKHSKVWCEETKALTVKAEFKDYRSWTIWRKHLGRYFDESKFATLNGHVKSTTRWA